MVDFVNDPFSEAIANAITVKHQGTIDLLDCSCGGFDSHQIGTEISWIMERILSIQEAFKSKWSNASYDIILTLSLWCSRDCINCSFVHCYLPKIIN